MTTKTPRKPAERARPALVPAEPAPDGAARKDRVLQARVSESLYAGLAAQARRLRVPVSNLVRNILEDSIRMVGTIVEGSLDIAETLAGAAGEDELAAVLGWQPMIANRRIACARCGRPIAKGADAFAGLGAPGARALVICGPCKEEP